MKSKEEGFGKAEQINLVRAKVRFEPTCLDLKFFCFVLYQAASPSGRSLERQMKCQLRGQ